MQVVFGDRSFNGVSREHLARGSGMRVEKPVRVRVEETNGCLPA